MVPVPGMLSVTSVSVYIRYFMKALRYQICHKIYRYLRRYKTYRGILHGENQVYLKFLVNFIAHGSGSAFPIRIQILDS
jgi:hypothetical protein